MPKETFFNLSEEKKQKIFDAAVFEFSKRRFSEASINQIIKNAGISRGSFYQYFENKEDIYLHMLTVIGKEKIEVIGDAVNINPDAGFFETYMHMVRLGFEWAKHKPHYSQIGMLMEIDDSKFIAKLRAMLSQGYGMLSELIIRDQERGLIKPGTDPDLIVEIIYVLNMHFLKDYAMNDSYDIEGMAQKAEQIIKIIKEGIAAN
jgi:TetR/AcrR family transcriptional regulator